MVTTDCHAYWQVVKRWGQLAQLTSVPPVAWRLASWAVSLGDACTFLVLGRPRSAIRRLRGRS